MRRVLIITLVIIIIISSIFVYKHLQNKNNVLNKIETTELIPVSSNEDKDFFLLYIDKVSIDNSSTVIAGKILKGKIKINEEISIVGLNKKEIVTKVDKIKINNNEISVANEGDVINLVLESNIPNDYIIQGQAVIKTGTTKPIYNINAKLNAISISSILEIEIKTDSFNINTDIKCSVKVISEEDREIKISLNVPIVVNDGIEFILKSNNKVIAKGITLNN